MREEAPRTKKKTQSTRQVWYFGGELNQGADSGGPDLSEQAGKASDPLTFVYFLQIDVAQQGKAKGRSRRRV